MGTPIPQALYDRAEILSRSHPLATVAEIVGLNRSTVSKMKARGWRAVDYTAARRSVPTDWAFIAPTMAINELAAHYGTSTQVVRRWLREKPARPIWRAGPQHLGRRPA